MIEDPLPRPRRFRRHVVAFRSPELTVMVLNKGVTPEAFNALVRRLCDDPYVMILRDDVLPDALRIPAQETINRQKKHHDDLLSDIAHVVSFPEPDTVLLLIARYSNRTHGLVQDEEGGTVGRDDDGMNYRFSESTAARAYSTGLDLDVAGHESEAVAWYRAGVELGSVPSETQLGRYYKKKGDYEKAIEMTLHAARCGCRAAQVDLGMIYRSGDMGIHSLRKSFLWFQRSAENDSPYGLYELGQCYELGIGVRYDAEQARKLFQKAAGLGSDLAKAKLEEPECTIL